MAGMGAGAGIGSAAGGFGRGLAKALLANRERRDQQAREDLARKDRAFQYKMPILIKLGEETGDWSPLESEFEAFDPESAKAWKKQGGLPFASLAPMLAPPQTGAFPEQAGQGPAPPPALAEPPVLPGRAAVSPGIPQPPRKTLFGVELPTDEEKATRAANAQTAGLQAQIGARRKVAEGVGLPPDRAVDYALYGDRPPAAAAAQTSRGIPLSPGQVLVDPVTGAERARGLDKVETPGNAPGAGSFDAQVLRKQAELGRPLTTGEVATERKSWEALNDPTPAAGTDQSDLAAMAADNPTMLQGLTPTVVGATLATIAKNPVLRNRFEQVRMQPLRTQAQTALGTLKDLLVLNPDGTPVLDAKGHAQLTDGGKWVFGKSRVLGQTAIGQYLIPESAGTAKAALDQLTGQLTLDLIREMKAQSRTGASGFGQLNLRELGVLENSATTLKGAITEEKAASELLRMYERFGQILKPSVNEQTPVTSGTRANVNITLDTPIFIGPDGRPSTTPVGAP